MQHSSTQQIHFAHKGDFSLRNLLVGLHAGVAALNLTSQLKGHDSGPQSRAFLCGGCLFLPGVVTGFLLGAISLLKNMPVKLTGNEILGVSVDNCLFVCLSVREVQRIN